MRAFLFLVLFPAAANATPRIWTTSCFELGAGKALSSTCEGKDKTHIQAFRVNDQADEYSDNIFVGDQSLSALLSFEHKDDHGFQWLDDQIVVRNNNSVLDCSLDFVITFMCGNPNDTIVFRLGGVNEYGYAGSVWPVTVMNQDYCTVLAPDDLNPEFEIYAGLYGASPKIFSTADIAVNGLNITRVYVFGPLFTYAPLNGRDLMFDIVKCGNIHGFPDLFTLVAGEDYMVVGSTDSFPNILAFPTKKFRLVGSKQATLTINARNFALLNGGVVATSESNGLSKTFTGTVQFDSFKVKGTNFTLDYTSHLSMAQIAAGQGRGEHFTLHIQPSRR